RLEDARAARDVEHVDETLARVGDDVRLVAQRVEVADFIDGASEVLPHVTHCRRERRAQLMLEAERQLLRPHRPDRSGRRDVLTRLYGRLTGVARAHGDASPG